MTATFGLAVQADGLVDNDTAYADSAEHAGDTPEFALILASLVSALDTITTHHVGSIGFFDGSDEFEVSWFSEDGVGNTENGKGKADDLCTFLADGSNSRDGHQVAAATRFGANAATLDTTNTYSDDYFHSVLTIAGDANLQVAAGVVEAGTPATVTVGFEADVLLFLGTGNSDANQTVSMNAPVLHGQIGVCLNDGSDTQMGVAQFEDDNQVASEPAAIISTNYVVQNYLAEAVDRAISIDNFTAVSGGQFDVNHVNLGSSGGMSAGWLALKFGGDETVKIGTFDTPTSISELTVSGLGHTPKCVILLATNCTALDSVQFGVAGESFGIGLLLGHAESCHIYGIEDGADATQTFSYADEIAMFLPDSPGTGDRLIAEGPGGDGGGAFNAGEFVLDFVAVEGTARKWGYISIGEPDVGAAFEQVSFRFRNDDGSLGPPPP